MAESKVNNKFYHHEVAMPYTAFDISITHETIIVNTNVSFMIHKIKSTLSKITIDIPHD